MKYEKQQTILRLFLIGKYACTQDGRVFGFSNNHGGLRSVGKELKPTCAGKRPYPKIMLVDERAKVMTVQVHQVVALFFHGPIAEGMVIDHRNSDIRDNRLENLEIVTVKENNRRAALKWTRKHCPKTGRILKCVP